MKLNRMLFLFTALIAGFAAGWLLRPTSGTGPAPASPEDLAPEEALRKLAGFYGRGSAAGRAAIELADRIVAGGEAIVPALRKAVEETGHWELGAGGWAIDMRGAAVTSHPTRRSALLEAAGRIGGDEAVKLLMQQAVEARESDDRLLSLVFLAPHAGRDDVRAFFGETLSRYCRARRSDTEAVRVFETLRGRLPADARGTLEAAIREGWAREAVSQALIGCFVGLDPDLAAGEDRAGDFLLALLMATSAPPNTRMAAAEGLARLPEHRFPAADRLMEIDDPKLVGFFLRGVLAGRFGEPERERAAFASGDPATWMAYFEERRRDLDARFEILDRLAERLGPAVAEQSGFPRMRDRLMQERNAVDATEKEFATHRSR